MESTQGETTGISRQVGTSRIKNADDLERYIKVTSTNAWVVLIAAVIMVAGLIVWAFNAVIPRSVTFTGVASNGVVVCWVDEPTAKKIRRDDARVFVSKEEVENIEVSSEAQSAIEVIEEVGSDYYAKSAQLADKNYKMTMTSSEPAAQAKDPRLVPVEITISHTHPIDLTINHEQ